MAEGKKSFLLYCDIVHTLEHLTDQQTGKLFKYILAYVNDKNPKIKDLVIRLAFEPIKQQLKRDLQTWDVTKQDRSNSGKIGNLKRWNRDLYDRVIKQEITVSEAEIIANDRKATNRVARVANVAVTDNVTVNVNDTVSVIEKVNTGGRKVFKKPTIEEIKTIIADPNEAEIFFNYYESKGWVVGKSPMKNWPASAKNWLKNEYRKTHQQPVINGSKRVTKSTGAELLARSLKDDLTAGGFEGS